MNHRMKWIQICIQNNDENNSNFWIRMKINIGYLFKHLPNRFWICGKRKSLRVFLNENLKVFLKSLIPKSQLNYYAIISLQQNTIISWAWNPLNISKRREVVNRCPNCCYRAWRKRHVAFAINDDHHVQ